MIYWFKRGNEEPFPIDSNATAWDMIYNRGKWQRQDIVYLGASSGEVFKRAEEEQQKAKDNLKKAKATLQDLGPRSKLMAWTPQQLEEETHKAQDAYKEAEAQIAEVGRMLEVARQEESKNIDPEVSPRNADVLIGDDNDTKGKLAIKSHFGI